jgi:hypothetical protein
LADEARIWRWVTACWPALPGAATLDGGEYGNFGILVWARAVAARPENSRAVSFIAREADGCLVCIY